MERLIVERGRFLCYRLLDVGDEIDLDRAQQRLAAAPAVAERRRLTLTRPGADSLWIARPPLDVGLGPRTLPLAEGPRAAQAWCRLFDHGVASVRFELELEPGTPLEALRELAHALQEDPALEVEARAVVAGLLPDLGDAITPGSTWDAVEPYSTLFVEAFAGHPTAEAVLAERALLVALLVGETSARPMAPDRVEDTLRSRFSYLDDDLVLVDWDGALVLEPSGSRDTADLIEAACAQLVTLRWYDEVLDRELRGMVDAVQDAGRHVWARVLWSPYTSLARRVQARWVDVTEFVDRIENTIKVVGDLYLARVYRGAQERFRLSAWRDGILRKQERIARVYDGLKGEVESRRMVVLETAITALIVLELVLALVGQRS